MSMMLQRPPEVPINQSMEEDSTISFIISDATFKDPDIGDFIVTYEMVLIDGTRSSIAG